MLFCEYCNCVVPKKNHRETKFRGKKIYLCTDGEEDCSCFVKWKLKNATKKMALKKSLKS